jgi:hypothetical protein
VASFLEIRAGECAREIGRGLGDVDSGWDPPPSGAQKVLLLIIGGVGETVPSEGR